MISVSGHLGVSVQFSPKPNHLTDYMKDNSIEEITNFPNLTFKSLILGLPIFNYIAGIYVFHDL